MVKDLGLGPRTHVIWLSSQTPVTAIPGATLSLQVSVGTEQIHSAYILMKAHTIKHKKTFYKGFKGKIFCARIHI